MVRIVHAHVALVDEFFWPNHLLKGVGSEWRLVKPSNFIAFRSTDDFGAVAILMLNLTEAASVRHQKRVGFGPAPDCAWFAASGAVRE